MAILNGDNFDKQFVQKPSEKIEKGEVAGRKRLLLEHKLLDSALSVNDEILGLFIPASSIVTGAKIVVDKSLGATGIFEAGFKDNGTDGAEDSSAFVNLADAGGQAVNKRDGAANAGIYKRFAKDAQVFIKCTEVMDGAVLDGTITLEVEYVND